MMEIIRFQQIQSCIDDCQRLISEMEENKESIRQCVSEQTASLYGNICDGAANKLRNVRNDLQSLQCGIM
jgi:hypothetical protein